MLSCNLNRKTTVGKLATPALCLLVSLAFAQSASAGGPLGIGANVGAGAQVGAGVNLPRAGAGAAVGAAGRAEAASPNVRALENSNGQIVTDREFGLDRAQERRSEQGAEHEKATEALQKRTARRANLGAAASGSASARNNAAASARGPRGASAGAASNAAADTEAAARQ